MFTEKMIMAFRSATTMHQKQKRKGSETPYIAHPMAVASLVLEHGGGEDVFCAALLHDTIEDCKMDPGLIASIFGQPVLDMVEAVTNPPIDWKSFKSNEELQHTLKAFRIIMFEKIREADPQVQLLSACDKLHNARGLLVDLRQARDGVGEGKKPEEVAQLVVAVWDRFRGKRQGTLWYYVELAKVYSESESAQVRNLGRELREVCDGMDADF